MLAEEIIRTALWWFSEGQVELRSTVRDRPTSPKHSRSFLIRTASLRDLAKGVVIIETVMPSFPILESGMTT